jgi:thiol-disulfide isomerase/thioredoxin
MKTILLTVALLGLLITSNTSLCRVYGADAVKKHQPRIYDESADGAKQVAKALVAAKKADKHVLLDFGANWCGWCIKLHKLFDSDRAIIKTLEANYVIALIDVNVEHNKDLIAKYRAEAGVGLPFLVILDADGKQWMTKDGNGWAEGGQYNPRKVLDFLRKWTPEVVRNTKVSQWVEEFVQMPDSGFDPSCLEFQRFREMGAAAVPALIDVIRATSLGGARDREESRRIRAYWALRALGPSAKSAVPFLVEQFRANDMRQWVSDTLAILGPEATEAVPALTDAFHSTDARLQFDAAFALAHVAPSTPGLVSTMAAWLSSSNVFCRRGAAIILGELGPTARAVVPELKNACGDSDETVRKRAVEALEKIGPRSDAPAKTSK